MTTKERMKLLEEWEAQFYICDNDWIGIEKSFRGLDPSIVNSGAAFKQS